MADTDTQVSPELISEARGMGWVPKEEFRGDAARWIDADQFVERGHTVMPILAKNNREMQAQLAAVQAENRRLAELVSQNQEAMTALDEYHTAETKRKVTEAREKLKKELVLATKDGDAEAVAQITDELIQNSAALDTPEAKKPADKPNPALAPEFIAWQANNASWLYSDKAKTDLAFAIALRLRRENPTVVGTPFYSLVDAELAKTAKPRPAGGKGEEGARGGESAGGGGHTAPGKNYSDLPPEAKDTCTRLGKQFVGKGKRYATAAEWQKKYVQQYFDQE